MQQRSSLVNTRIKLQKIREDKLGQRQSQTPFSSAFWVKKDFEPKRFWFQKCLQTNDEQRYDV